MTVLKLTSFGKISSIFLFALSGKHVAIFLQDVLIGKLDELSDLLNYFLIIAKWHIWRALMLKLLLTTAKCAAANALQLHKNQREADFTSIFFVLLKLWWICCYSCRRKFTHSVNENWSCSMIFTKITKQPLVNHPDDLTRGSHHLSSESPYAKKDVF